MIHINCVCLRNSKDQKLPLSSAGICKTPCSCGQVYIGQPGRMVRLKHAMPSALSEHNTETAHQILFDKTTTIANIASYFPRKYREAIEI